MSEKLLLKGVAVLFFATIVAKIIGAVYRIPLTWVLGAQGLGVYQLVFPVFSLLLVLSSTGAPTAISTMVAERLKAGEIINAKKVFSVSAKTLFVFGLVAGGLLLALSGGLCAIQSQTDAWVCYAAISFALPLVAILSAHRGFHQGAMNMLPTALSQIIEQACKLIFGLLFAYLFSKQGAVWGAFGAVLGVVISEVVAVLFIIIYSKIKLKSILEKQTCSQNYQIESSKHILKQFIKSFLPIVGCSFVLPVLQVADSVLIVPTLGIAGFNVQNATSMWGISSGVVNSLVNLPVVLTTSVAISIAPTLRMVSKNSSQVAKNINYANRLTFNTAFPFCVVFVCLSYFILNFLYGKGGLTYDELNLANHLLILNSLFILPMCFVQVSNSILQGLNCLKVPLINMLIAAIVKIFLMWLCAVGSINIFGLSISNIAFYLIVLVLNWFYLSKHFAWRPQFRALKNMFVSTCLMAFFLVLGVFALNPLSVYLALPILGVLGVSVYFSTYLVLGGAEELKLILQKLKNIVYNKKRL